MRIRTDVDDVDCIGDTGTGDYKAVTYPSLCRSLDAAELCAIKSE
jgi:hypothetical protein